MPHTITASPALAAARAPGHADAAAWCITLAAAALMALTVGGRNAFGLFVSPLNTATGLGLAHLSLAMAIGQLALGFSQPLVGAMADRFGAARVIVLGAIVLAASTAVPVFTAGGAAVAASLVITAVAASAVGSNGLLVGEVNRVVPPAWAGLAVGIVGAGAVGQLLLGPTMQWAIDHQGWRTALLTLALLSLVGLPLSLALRRSPDAVRVRTVAPVGDALSQWSFWRAALSFGVCGFHVAFLSVHMPGVIERCGLPTSLAGTWLAVAGAANIAGSVAIGYAMKRRSADGLLAMLYGVRAAGIALLLLLPSSVEVMLAFGVVMGASYMATLPPTAQLVAREHGIARLGTLFGVVMLVHQIGSFAGIWLGGWAVEVTGSDTLVWGIDLGLALLAAWLVLPARRSSAVVQP